MPLVEPPPQTAVHRPPHARRRSGFISRQVGLALAIVLAVGILVVLALAMLRAQTNAAGPQGQQATDEMTLPPEALAQRPETAASPSLEAPTVETITGSDIGVITSFDEATGELVRRLTYDRFEPLPRGRFAVEKPRAELFMDDGSVVEIIADDATFTQRQGTKQPQSGNFEGNVEIRLFEDADAPLELGENERPPMRDPATAAVAVFTDSLQFDVALGELRTDAPIRAVSEAVDFRGTGLNIVFSEAERALLLLRLEQGERMVFKPAARRSGDRRAASDENATPSAPEQASQELAMYRAVFTGPVRIENGARSLASERIDLWLRLRDGELAPGAIAPIRFARADDGRSDSPDARSDDEAQAGLDFSQEITLAWSGPLEIRPLSAPPAELRSDDVFARFSSPESGVVRLDDPENSAQMLTGTLEYAATTGRVTLAGLGPQSVALRIEDRGEALASRFEADLLRGIAAFPGPGVIRAIGAGRNLDMRDVSGDTPPRDVSWRGRCDVDFVRTDEGEVVLALRQARLSDGVLAREAGTEASARNATLDFIDAPGGSALARVVLAGDAVTDAGDRGRLAADRLDLALDPNAERLTPTVLTAEGNARASGEGSTIRGELIEATFASVDGSIEIDTVRADLGVEVVSGTGSEQITAYADKLHARPADRFVELVGAPASVSKGRGSMRGDAIRLDGSRGVAQVFGAGDAVFEQPRRSGRASEVAYTRMGISWDRAMDFDDQAGRAVFVGGVVAQGEAGPALRDVARGERLVLTFHEVIDEEGSGEGEEPTASPDAPLAELESSDRRIDTITLTGRAAEGAGDGLAEIESRRYVASQRSETGYTLQRLAFVSSDEIRAMAETGEVLAPGPGRLLLEDRSRRTSDAPASSSGGSAAEGTTLFEWAGSLRFSRLADQADMTRGVRVRHLPPNESEAAELEAERLTALLSDEADTVERIEASGAVYAHNRQKRLVADRVIYDPRRSLMEVFASPGNLVSVFDEELGVPATAEALVWNLETGALRAFRAGAVSTPR